MTDIRILLVEDDPVVTYVTQLQLAQLGFAIDTVSNGEDAVERYHGDFSLILMDVGLPGIDGIKTTKLIREKEHKEGLKRVPIIAMTAHSNRQQCLAAGMDDHLQKPGLLGDLAHILNMWLPKEISNLEHG